MGQKTSGDYAKEYAKLMSCYNEGNYLYKPAPYRTCHPGSVGFFDGEGNWNEITDLEQERRVKAVNLKPFEGSLKREDTRIYKWDSRTSDGESELSFEGNAELSGALSSAPVDVGGNAKNKKGKSNKANLVTGSVVKHERLSIPFRDQVKKWVKANAKDLVQGDYGEDIKDYGLWVVRATYVTQECAITMDSTKSQDLSLGGNVGATGIAKLGAGGSSLSKFSSAGWSTYTASESDQGLVVSFSGLQFGLRPFSTWRSVPLRTISEFATAERIVSKVVLDENGNVTGYEDYRVKGKDTDGNDILEKIDREAEKKAAEEEEKRRKDEEFETADDFMVDDEPIGMSEEELEEERKAEQLENEAKRKEHEKRTEKARKELEDISKISDGTAQKSALEQWKKDHPEYLRTLSTTKIYTTYIEA